MTIWILHSAPFLRLPLHRGIGRLHSLLLPSHSGTFPFRPGQCLGKKRLQTMVMEYRHLFLLHLVRQRNPSWFSSFDGWCTLVLLFVPPRLLCLSRSPCGMAGFSNTSSRFDWNGRILQHFFKIWLASILLLVTAVRPFELASASIGDEPYTWQRLSKILT